MYIKCESCLRPPLTLIATYIAEKLLKLTNSKHSINQFDFCFSKQIFKSSKD